MSEVFTSFVLTDREKFLLKRKHAAKIFKYGNDLCHLWAGSVSRDGYGYLQIMFRGKSRKLSAHRLAYFISCGFDHLPADMHVSHVCHNKLCVNRLHLSLEPAYINLRRNVCVQRRACTGHHGYQNCIL